MAGGFPPGPAELAARDREEYLRMRRLYLDDMRRRSDHWNSQRPPLLERDRDAIGLTVAVGNIQGYVEELEVLRVGLAAGDIDLGHFLRRSADAGARIGAALARLERIAGNLWPDDYVDHRKARDGVRR